MSSFIRLYEALAWSTTHNRFHRYISHFSLPVSMTNLLWSYFLKFSNLTDDAYCLPTYRHSLALAADADDGAYYISWWVWALMSPGPSQIYYLGRKLSYRSTLWEMMGHLVFHVYLPKGYHYIHSPWFLYELFRICASFACFLIPNFITIHLWFFGPFDQTILLMMQRSKAFNVAFTEGE